MFIKKDKGHFRESNPGPLAPKARIIPLDQSATCVVRDSNPGHQLGRLIC